MILLFAHGWGFDAGFWTKLTGLLPQYRCLPADRGYFGTPQPGEPEPDRPVIAITHSFGTMAVLRHPPANCRGLVAINSFDCFTTRADAAGVAPRLIKRMLAQFERDPAAVLADFRLACGWSEPFGALQTDRLRHDLQALANLDCRADTARWPAPILSLQAARDPILPVAMRDQVFASARHLTRATHPVAGHLLPIEDPGFCASQITRFIDQLP